MASEHTERAPEPLRGYRKPTNAERILVDEIKRAEQNLAKLWARVHDGCVDTDAIRYSLAAEGLFRAGFMELVRSVTRPRDAYREQLAEVEAWRKGKDVPNPRTIQEGP